MAYAPAEKGLVNNSKKTLAFPSDLQVSETIRSVLLISAKRKKSTSSRKVFTPLVVPCMAVRWLRLIQIRAN